MYGSFIRILFSGDKTICSVFSIGVGIRIFNHKKRANLKKIRPLVILDANIIKYYASPLWSNIPTKVLASPLLCPSGKSVLTFTCWVLSEESLSNTALMSASMSASASATIVAVTSMFVSPTESFALNWPGVPSTMNWKESIELPAVISDTSLASSAVAAAANLY